ncbi:MAG: hypothetical protein Q9173_000385 [Seirophora scorigena]
MAYFLPSYFQKRILRYALSRLDLLDAEQLNLDNLDIAWGKRSVIELRDVGVQMKKLAALLGLPSCVILVKASIRLLRITVPADLYSSGIVAEIDGVDIQLDADTHSEEEHESADVEVRKDEVNPAQGPTNTDRPRSLRPQIHDPGGRPSQIRHWSQTGDESPDSAVLPTTDDLAKSFLQAEPKKEKANLQAAVAQSRQMDESDIFDDSDPKTTVGVGNGLSLPGFLSGFLKGIEERFHLRLRDVKLDVLLHVELPSDNSLATAARNRPEEVTLRLSAQDVEYSKAFSSHSNRESQAAVGLTPPNSNWVRQIKFGNIQAAILSDASIFSSLLPSLAPSSSSESTVAGSSSEAPRRRRAKDGPFYSSRLSDVHRGPTSSPAPLSGLSQRLDSSSGVGTAREVGATPPPAERVVIPTSKGSTTKHGTSPDSYFSENGNSGSGYESSYNFQGSPKQNLPSRPIISAKILTQSGDKRLTHDSQGTVVRLERQSTDYDESHSRIRIPTESYSPEIQHNLNPSAEDLAESKIFSHEEAESMYMSAMSNVDVTEKSIDKIMPGAWYSQLQDDEPARAVIAKSASRTGSPLTSEQNTRKLDPIEHSIAEGDNTPSPLLSPATPTSPPDERNMTEPDPITKRALRQRLLKTPELLEADTEGSLIVSKTFMLIDNVSITVPHVESSPDSPPSQSLRSDVVHSLNARSRHARLGYLSTSFIGEGPNLEKGWRNSSAYATPSPESDVAGPTTRVATSVDIGAVEFKTDMSLAKLTALIIQQAGKLFLGDTSTSQEDKRTTMGSQAEIRMHVANITWSFYDRLIGLPAVKTVDASAQVEPEGAFVGSELLLRATIRGLENVSQSTRDSYKSKVSVARISFGYASDNILSFDSTLKMRESTRDTLAPTNEDLVLTISKDTRASKVEVTTLPVLVHLDLRRLDETFSWLGGFSSILDLGNSMISTVTSLDAVNRKKRQSIKPSRGVHFESPGTKPPVEASPPQDPTIRKVTARIGGLTCELLGSESSVRFEGSALKAVSRAEGLGLQVDRLKASGLHAKSLADQPAIVGQLSNVRMEYLSEPKEVDLARLLALLSPSRDHYEVEDDILLDTLLRQRRQGGVVRLTAEKSENRMLDFDDLQHFSTLAEELKKLGSVTKYLPEDDRPGILTLALVRQLRCEAQIGASFGFIEVDLKNVEFAHVTLPSLVAVGVSHVHLCRNGDEELVTAATQIESPEASPVPMIMARFIGNEMEPTVKVKLYNVRVEYHVPFVSAMMECNGSMQSEELLMDLASSIATLTEKQRWKDRMPDSPRSATTPPGKSTPIHISLKLDVTVRDSLVGLNPRKSSAKGVVVLTETHFAGFVPKHQEAHATLEIQKAAFMVVDDQENVKKVQVYGNHSSAHSGVPQLQALEAMGYVSVSSISAARAVLQITHDKESSSRSIDVEIKDDFFVLESCADSTQTLQVILNGLAPPLPQNKDVKYRTEVVPIEDMLSSFSGMAFASDGARVENSGEETLSLEDEDAGSDDEYLHDPGMGNSFYDLESSEQYDGVSESMLDDESDSVMVDPSDQAMEGHPSLSGSSSPSQGESEGPPLEFQDDHFGSGSAVGGTAHRWDTKQNTYGLSNEATIRKSPIRVRVRDVHVIWNLFDGYDWQRTRDTIGQAIADVESKALNQQSKRDKRKPPEDESDEESVIGDFLFNSIYIGIPANKDPRSLSRQVSRHLDDLVSDSESSAPSTVTNLPKEPSAPSPARSSKPRLARSKHHKMTFELKGISADLVVFPPEAGETQSSVDVRIQDLEIFDHVPTSTWKKFATYMQDAGERESGTSMIHVEMLNVRPVPDLAASEIILKATILPLRLHVDQDALDFMTRFFEFKDDRAKDATAQREAPFLQRVEVNSVRLRLDFKPKRVDYAGIRSGRTNEFMNFFILDRADMVLRHVIIYGISGFDRLGKTLNDIWMPDIKRNQLPGILAGLAPVRSLVNVGSGVRDLVVIPIREYQKDGRVVRSLQKGALAFAKTTTSELVKLGAKMAIGTQTVLQGAEDLLTQTDAARHEVAGGWEEAGLDAEEKKQISLYADQPVGVIQGLRGAYASLERDLLTAKDAIVAMPGEVMLSGTAGGAAKAVLRGAPTVILRPALGVSKAVGRTLMGATNSLDPENRRRIDEVRSKRSHTEFRKELTLFKTQKYKKY